MIIRHAKPADRITGWSNSQRGYPAGESYVCPSCEVSTDFPQPASELDSYVDDDVTRMFVIETRAARINHNAAVEFYCQGCLLPVRVLLNHYDDGRGTDSSSVVEILELVSAVK